MRKTDNADVELTEYEKKSAIALLVMLNHKIPIVDRKPNIKLTELAGWWTEFHFVLHVVGIKGKYYER